MTRIGSTAGSAVPRSSRSRPCSTSSRHPATGRADRTSATSAHGGVAAAGSSRRRILPVRHARGLERAALRAHAHRQRAAARRRDRSRARGADADRLRSIAQGVSRFLIGRLQLPSGGFASAQDSESVIDGERSEGGYYRQDAGSVPRSSRRRSTRRCSPAGTGSRSVRSHRPHSSSTTTPVARGGAARGRPPPRAPRRWRPPRARLARRAPSPRPPRRWRTPACSRVACSSSLRRAARCRTRSRRAGWSMLRCAPHRAAGHPGRRVHRSLLRAAPTPCSRLAGSRCPPTRPRVRHRRR